MPNALMKKNVCQVQKFIETAGYFVQCDRYSFTSRYSKTWGF
ncbi:hypothetical protein [Nostoc linckia]|nr:hypothetical protein [Nostoc linckia]